jgi:hypothetical protein
MRVDYQDMVFRLGKQREELWKLFVIASECNQMAWADKLYESVRIVDEMIHETTTAKNRALGGR